MHIAICFFTNLATNRRIHSVFEFSTFVKVASMNKSDAMEISYST